MKVLPHRSLMINVGVVVATSLYGCVGATAGEPLVLFEKPIRLDAKSYMAKVRRVDYQETLRSQDGAEYVQRLRDVVLELRPLGNSLGSRVVWWQTSPIQGDSVVTGNPIYAIAVLAVGEVDFLVLAIANSYYRGARVIVIDPRHTISDPPSTNADEGIVPARTRSWEAKSIIVTRSSDSKSGGLYGTRTLEVATDDGEIILNSVDAGGKRNEASNLLEESDREKLRILARLWRAERKQMAGDGGGP